MKRYIARIAVATSLLAALTVAGCATSGTDLKRNQIVEIEKTSSSYARVGVVGAYQEDSTISVHGIVIRKRAGRSPIPGHVDVELRGPAGDILDSVSVAYRPTAKRRSGIFWATLDGVAPVGSTIRVSHDPGSRAE